MDRTSHNSVINRDEMTHKRKTPSRNNYDGETLTNFIRYYNVQKRKNKETIRYRMNDIKLFIFVKCFIPKYNNIGKRTSSLVSLAQYKKETANISAGGEN